MINVSLRLADNLKSGVEIKANELGISENAVISLAVSEYIREQCQSNCKE
jgi:hypothetical protein